MTWGEVKLAALQRIFSNDGVTLNKDDSNEEYLNAMPAVANEALTILTGVGVPLLRILTVEITPEVTEPTLENGLCRCSSPPEAWPGSICARPQRTIGAWRTGRSTARRPAGDMDRPKATV